MISYLVVYRAYFYLVIMKELNILILVGIGIIFILYRVRTLKRNTYGNHREIYTKLFGPIPDGYEIHHANGVKGDNRGRNLIAIPAHFHAWIHCQEMKEYKAHISKIKKSGKFKPYKAFKKFRYSKRKVNRILTKYLKDNNKSNWKVIKYKGINK